MLNRVVLKRALLPAELSSSSCSVSCVLATPSGFAGDPSGTTVNTKLEPFIAAASGLHPKHRNPHVLSRCAASRAMEDVSGGLGTSAGQFVFVGSRSEALAAHGVHLSLSHEPLLGAAVAWPATNSPCTFAVDVAEISALYGLSRRQPRFRERWLGQCCLPFSSEAGDERSDEREAFLTHVFAAATEDGRDDLMPWWASATVGGSPRAALNALVLAQHWSVRECCVKLLGIPNRAFDVKCLLCTHDLVPPPKLRSAKPHSMPCGALVPGHVYATEVTGNEREAFLSCGKDPTVRLCSWLELVSDDDDATMCSEAAHKTSCLSATRQAYVVTAACCQLLT